MKSVELEKGLGGGGDGDLRRDMMVIRGSGERGVGVVGGVFGGDKRIREARIV